MFTIELEPEPEIVICLLEKPALRPARALVPPKPFLPPEASPVVHVMRL